MRINAFCCVLAHCKHPTVLGDINKINRLAPATKWIPESDLYRGVMRSNMTAAEGRFCLNDLHVASGGADKDKPGNWSALDETKALVAEALIDGSPAIKTRAGSYGGSFAVMELVYAYATWISPAFNADVIPTYDVARHRSANDAENSATTI